MLQATLPGKQNIVADEESRAMRDRTDWMLCPQTFHKNQQSNRTPLSGPVCISPDSPTTGLCELEARPQGNGSGCLYTIGHSSEGMQTHQGI